MKSRVIAFCCVAALLAGPVATLAGSAAEPGIKAGTPEGNRVVAELKRARDLDRMNYRSYSGGDSSDTGIFYYRKSQEADALLQKLRAGKTVSPEAVKKALDNSGAARLGGTL